MALKQIKGFTAMELIVVVVILGILVTLTFPRFAAMGEKSFGNEARANLLLIATAEETRQLEQGTYYFSSNITNINTNLHLSLPTSNQRHWDYSITNAADYTIFADRLGTGGFLACQYTLTRANYQAGNPPTRNAFCPQ